MDPEAMNKAEGQLVDMVHRHSGRRQTQQQIFGQFRCNITKDCQKYQQLHNQYKRYDWSNNQKDVISHTFKAKNFQNQFSSLHVDILNRLEAYRQLRSRSTKEDRSKDEIKYQATSNMVHNLPKHHELWNELQDKIEMLEEMENQHEYDSNGDAITDDNEFDVEDDSDVDDEESEAQMKANRPPPTLFSSDTEDDTDKHNSKKRSYMENNKSNKNSYMKTNKNALRNDDEVKSQSTQWMTSDEQHYSGKEGGIANQHTSTIGRNDHGHQYGSINAPTHKSSTMDDNMMKVVMDMMMNMQQQQMNMQHQQMDHQKQSNQMMIELMEKMAIKKEEPMFRPSPTLPELRFDGDATRYKAFIRSFDNLYGRFSPCDKFDIMMGLLRGKAKSKVDGFICSDENYSVIRKILDDTYGKDEIILNELHERLEMIKVAPEHDTEGQSESFEEYEKIMRQLEAMGYDVEQVTYARRLDQLLPVELVQELKKMKRHFPTWKIKDSRKHIMDHFESLQEAKKSKNINNSNAPARVMDNNRHFDGNNTSHTRSGRKLHGKTLNDQHTQDHPIDAAPGGTTVIERCIFCSGKHQTSECRAEISPNTKRRMLINKGICFICLKNVDIHGRGNCPERCSQCNGTHHQILCDTNPDELNVQVYNVNTNTHASFLTKKVMVDCNGQQKEFNVLLDSGSDVTLIRTSAAKKLKTSPINKQMMRVSGVDGKRQVIWPSKYEINMILENGERYSTTAWTMDRVAEAMVIGDNDNAAPEHIDILLGVNDLLQLLPNTESTSSGRMVIKTKLGSFAGGSGQRRTTSLQPIKKLIAADNPGYGDNNTTNKQNHSGIKSQQIKRNCGSHTTHIPQLLSTNNHHKHPRCTKTRIPELDKSILKHGDKLSHGNWRDGTRTKAASHSRTKKEPIKRKDGTTRTAKEGIAHTGMITKPIIKLKSLEVDVKDGQNMNQEDVNFGKKILAGGGAPQRADRQKPRKLHKDKEASMLKTGQVESKRGRWRSRKQNPEDPTLAPRSVVETTVKPTVHSKIGTQPRMISTRKHKQP